MNPPIKPALWWCVQTGHRERYAVPVALHRAGLLDHLATDLWVPPLTAKLLGGRLGRRLRDRYHPDLPPSKIVASPGRVAAFELAAWLRGEKGSARILRRNEWWSELCAKTLAGRASPDTTHVFSYCYEARELFRAADRRGLRGILGQIDPGPFEDRKVEAITRQWSQFRTPFRRGSADYYVSWREECDRAHRIIVNSQWSREALESEGIDSKKIVTIPLVYVPPAEAMERTKDFPDAFTPSRPLRVLFLGQCILRKGIAETIAAAQRLEGKPVEFTLVGNTNIAEIRSHFGGARISWHPRVSRAECDRYLREADVFLFPTHSDGFGLTQLEAQAWRLPIIASKYCAEVVADGVNGWVLPEVSSESIVEAVEGILGNPAELRLRSAAIKPWPFRLDDLGQRLMTISA